jgi:hypothetical protein
MSRWRVLAVRTRRPTASCVCLIPWFSPWFSLVGRMGLLQGNVHLTGVKPASLRVTTQSGNLDAKSLQARKRRGEGGGAAPAVPYNLTPCLPLVYRGMWSSLR